MTNTIPLLDLKPQHQALNDEIRDAIERVMQSQRFILGEEVDLLEREIAAYCGTAFGVGLASGTDALTLSLRALGIGPGDEVIVPAFTFFATVESVLHVGATPVFADIRADTYCIDVDAVDALVTANTRAVIPVHLFGHPADLDALNELAARRRLLIVEDNAQAFGAQWRGQATGSAGDVGCLSFFPSKNLGCCGDGGMVVTSNQAIADNLRMLRMHGWKRKNFPEIIGYNSRLDTLQAAILRAKLPAVERWNEQRRQAAETYRAALSGLDLACPVQAPGARHVYNLYVIRVRAREAVQRVLNDRGIGNAVYYPAAVNQLQPCRRFVPSGRRFPVAERAAEEVLAIPIFPGITEEQQQRVVEALSDAVAPRSRVVA